MKANEMEVLSNEELISYLQQVHPWYADLAEADPVHEVQRRLRTLTALEAKIKGIHQSTHKNVEGRLGGRYVHWRGTT